MTLLLTCPACHEPQAITNPEAGGPLRCPKCEAEIPASAPPAVAKPRRRVGRLLGILALVAVVGAAGYFIVTRSRPGEFTDPKGMFTARFPNTPTTTTVSTANPAILRWGEEVTKTTSGGREYAIMVLEGLNTGDQDVSPATRDTQINSILVLAGTNLNGDIVHERPATHEGHAGREVVLVSRSDGRLTAVRLVVGEHSGIRMSVTGFGNRGKPETFLDAAADFFGSVRLGPAFGPPVLEDPVTVSAADLGAAYRTDPKAADAKFKGRWVRVTGPVTSAPADGKTFEMDAGGTTVAVERGTRGRLSVRVRAGAGNVTVTGKCQGMAEPTAGAGPRIALTDATVVRTPKADEPK